MEGQLTQLRWWQTRTFVLFAALVSAIPLLWPDIPPMVDLPGHMGRYRVQLAIHDYPWLSDWYDFRWSLIGNLGIDLLIIPLSKVFGLELAVKLIVMTIPPLTVTGLLWIAREVHGRIPATALFALPLAYCFPFHFGFVNFALSMALGLNAFGLWLRLARTGHLRLRAAIFVPISCLIWLCHTFGWGTLGILAFSAEMIRQHDMRKDGRGHRWFNAWVRAGIGCLPLAVPMALMIFWRSGDHVTGVTGDWFNWRAKSGWLTMVLKDRWMVFDVASTAVVYFVLFKSARDSAVKLAYRFGIGKTQPPDGEIEFSRNLGLSALFLLAVFVLLPRIVFGSAYADMRLAPFMLAIAVIALRPRDGVSMRGAANIAALGLAFFLVRTAGTTISFWIYDQSYDRQLKALDHVPIGAKLISFVGEECGNQWFMTRLEHLPAIALERRLAYSNDQWSMPGAQLLTTRYDAAKKFAHDSSQIVTSSQCPREWWRPISRSLALFPRDAFDYVWLIIPPAYDPRFNQGLDEVWRDGSSVLFKIDHNVPAAKLSAEEMAPLIRAAQIRAARGLPPN
ncbi:hypothetical protein BH09PSE4_BH09PSE4_22910 [soil metagenome]